MKTHLYLIPILLIVLYSCSSDEQATDASGVFEATEIIVSAEASGKFPSLLKKVKSLQKVGLWARSTVPSCI